MTQNATTPHDGATTHARTSRRGLLGGLALALGAAPALARAPSDIERLGAEYATLTARLDALLAGDDDAHLNEPYQVLDAERIAVADRLCVIPVTTLQEARIKAGVAADWWSTCAYGGEYQHGDRFVAAVLRDLAPPADRYWLEVVR